MKTRNRSILASVVVVLVLTLLVPGPLAGHVPRALFTQGPSLPTLPPPVTAEPAAAARAYPGCGGQLAPVVDASYEQQVVDLVNSVRASNGLPPYKRVDSLDEAARYHATDMAQDNYFDHDSYDRSGSSLVLACGWSARVTTYYSGWSHLAENIAAGYGTPTAVMDGWMNSPGHRGNILSADNWEIGVGFYSGGGDYYNYWVQDFGRRFDVYPLIINADAATTTASDVTLYIYGAWQEMRLCNDAGTWTNWLPFQSTVNWTLPAAQGHHTVSAELRDGGLTSASSDTIYLRLVARQSYFLPIVVR